MTYDDAIATFGSQSGLAKALGITRQAVALWKRHGIPPKYQPALAKLALHIIAGEEQPEAFNPRTLPARKVPEPEATPGWYDRPLPKLPDGPDLWNVCHARAEARALAAGKRKGLMIYNNEEMLALGLIRD